MIILDGENICIEKQKNIYRIYKIVTITTFWKSLGPNVVNKTKDIIKIVAPTKSIKKPII